MEQPRQLYVPKSQLSTIGPKIVGTWVVHEEPGRYMPGTINNIVQDLSVVCSSESKYS